MPTESDLSNRRRQLNSLKSNFEKATLSHRDFPNCKGLYPDCPETPDLTNPMCRTCPKTDGLKKPKVEDFE